MRLIGRLLGRRVRWEEAWHAYPGWVDDEPATWWVDLGAVAAAPIADLPVRLDVAARYPAIDPEPTGDGSYLEELEQVVRVVATDLGGAYVGRVARAGDWRLTAHLPAQPEEPVTLSWRGGGELPAARLGVVAEYDPHWAYVRDRLAPDERQSQLLADLTVIGTLTGHGDALARPREVAHVAYFPNPDAAASAAADLRAEGFTATVERDDEGEFALTAVRSHPVAPPDVHDVIWSVRDTAERHGGTYDGWSCAVTMPLERP